MSASRQAPPFAPRGVPYRRGQLKNHVVVSKKSAFASRCKMLQDNIHSNEMTMQSNKAILEEIRRKRQLRQQQQERDEQQDRDEQCTFDPTRSFLAEEKAHKCIGEIRYGVCPTACAQAGWQCRGLGALESGSMMARFRALQRNAAMNEEMLQDHRAFIDTRQNESSELDKQVATTQVHDTRDAVRPEISLTWQMHSLTRPSSAPSNATQHRPQRPQSACSLPAGRQPPKVLTRPVSACSLSPAGIVQVPDEMHGRLQRPMSASSLIAARSQLDADDASSRRSRSRPQSASSISGRFAAIEENLHRNKALMRDNLEDIVAVKKKRQESAQKNLEAMDLGNRPTAIKLLDDSEEESMTEYPVPTDF